MFVSVSAGLKVKSQPLTVVVALRQGCMLTLLLFIVYNRDLNFLQDGHTSYYTKVQGPDILRNVTVSGYVTFWQINKFFVNMFFYNS